MADTKKTVHLIIERQDSPTGKPYTEEFEIPYRPALNVVAALMEIQKNPVTKDGKNYSCSLGMQLLRKSMWCLYDGY